jgi:hippurate hydrolase
VTVNRQTPAPDPSLLSGLLREAKTLLPEAVALRRRIHRRPEVGLDLPDTQRAVLEGLSGLPLDVAVGAQCSSVVATLAGARPGPTILLRADMDALPLTEDTGLDFASERDGVMHACGHDAHSAMLVSAAQLLARHCARLNGNVRFMFQPGEEGYHGARDMIEEGLLENPAVDAAFALHSSPVLACGMVTSRPGPFLASADVVRIRFRGRGGHASQPHLALDPIPAACEAVLALQSLVTRRVDIFDPAVVTIATVEAGTAHNVIPETATLVGTVRALSATTRQALWRRIREVAVGIAAAHGLTCDVDVEEGYPPTRNDERFAPWALDVARAVVASHAVEVVADPVMAADDFSYVLERVPGAMAFLGTAPPGAKQPAPNHSNRMVLNEDAMATGIALHAAVALSYLA